MISLRVARKSVKQLPRVYALSMSLFKIDWIEKRKELTRYKKRNKKKKTNWKENERQNEISAEVESETEHVKKFQCENSYYNTDEQMM